MGNCAGIDWASEKHDVLIEDPAGEELLAATFAHDWSGGRGRCSPRLPRNPGVTVSRHRCAARRAAVSPAQPG